VFLAIKERNGLDMTCSPDCGFVRMEVGSKDESVVP
jgi:hypothetical protein